MILGFLSGLTGVGGGIFLSPLLFLNWAETRVISGVSAAFILVNSASGLLGLMSTHQILPPVIPLWTMAAIAGGYIGAEFGSRYFPASAIQRLLAIVLAIAGLKMILMA